MPGPQGTYWGIRNAAVAAAYGEVVSYWWHVESEMAVLLNDLLIGKKTESYGSDLPSITLFRSIVSQKARIDVMRELLEQSDFDPEQTNIYKSLIDAFNDVNTERNMLVHAAWFTDIATGKVTIEPQTKKLIRARYSREMSVEALEATSARMRELYEAIALRRMPAIRQ